MKLKQAIKKTFVKYGERNALSLFSFPNSIKTLTYQDLGVLVDNFSAYILGQGFKKNDYLLSFMNKSHNLPVAILASMLCGGVATALNHKIKLHQFAEIAKKTKSKFVTLDQFTLLKFLNITGQLNDESLYIFFEKQAEKGKKNPLLQRVSKNINIHQYTEESIISNNINYNDIKTNGNSPCFCLFTSGSTGSPKGVLISRDDFLERANTEKNDYELTKDDNLLSLLPFSFDVGLNQFFSSFLSGGHLIMLNSWFTKDILNAVKMFNITGISGVPSIWHEILSAESLTIPEDCLNSLRYITVSGGDLSKNNLIKLADYFKNVNIYKTYGQSETFRSGILRPSDFKHKMTSVGTPPKA